MAYYLVTAKPKSDRLRDLLSNLRKHIYSPMRPFGKAMTHALENASLREDGYAVWEEEDYCRPPLAEEHSVKQDSPQLAAATIKPSSHVSNWLATRRSS